MYISIQGGSVNTAGVVDRASRRLFYSGTLHPKSKDYISISQKLLSAAASRYCVFWMAQLLSYLMTQHPGEYFYAIPGQFQV